MEDGESRYAKEVRPEKIMMRRVAELIDREVVGCLLVSPEELVSRTESGRRCTGLPDLRLVYEDVDVMVRTEPGDELDAADRDAGADRGHRAEPGETHASF
jgi:hypothetical protein